MQSSVTQIQNEGGEEEEVTSVAAKSLYTLEYANMQNYNLQLVTLIGEAYAPSRAEKILKKFRQTNIEVLRQHYMLAIFNPKFDYSEVHMEDEQGLYDNVEEINVENEEKQRLGDTYIPKERKLAKLVLNELKEESSKMEDNSPRLRGKPYKKALAHKYKAQVPPLAISAASPNKKTQAVYNTIRLNQSLNNSLRTDPNESVSKKSNRLSMKSGY